MPWQCLRDGAKSLDSIGFLGWKRRIYTLFTPLEDRIGNQENDKCRHNLKKIMEGCSFFTNEILTVTTETV